MNLFQHKTYCRFLLLGAAPCPLAVGVETSSLALGTLFAAPLAAGFALAFCFGGPDFAGGGFAVGVFFVAYLGPQECKSNPIDRKIMFLN